MTNKELLDELQKPIEKKEVFVYDILDNICDSFQFGEELIQVIDVECQVIDVEYR